MPDPMKDSDVEHQTDEGVRISMCCVTEDDGLLTFEGPPTPTGGIYEQVRVVRADLEWLRDVGIPAWLAEMGEEDHLGTGPFLVTAMRSLEASTVLRAVGTLEEARMVVFDALTATDDLAEHFGGAARRYADSIMPGEHVPLPNGGKVDLDAVTWDYLRGGAGHAPKGHEPRSSVYAEAILAAFNKRGTLMAPRRPEDFYACPRSEVRKKAVQDPALAAQTIIELREEVARLREERDHYSRDLNRHKERLQRLREAFAEYQLWEPGRAGYAAARRRLTEAFDA